MRFARSPADLAMLDTTTGEVVHLTLTHEGNNVRQFYSTLPRPVCVGSEATGSMQWLLTGRGIINAFRNKGLVISES
jgi:hypothetical protein